MVRRPDRLADVVQLQLHASPPRLPAAGRAERTGSLEPDAAASPWASPYPSLPPDPMPRTSSLGRLGQLSYADKRFTRLEKSSRGYPHDRAYKGIGCYAKR